MSAIADEASVTRAAGRLHLSQSAVSHQLVDLERELGIRLFDRVGKRMVPTAAGQRLVVAGAAVLQQLSSLETQLHRDRHEARTALRVTTSCYVSYHWLPSALTHFGASHPRLDLAIVLEATRRALAALTADEVDLAIMTDPPRDQTWEVVEIASSQLVALCSPAHPAMARARRASLRWGDLGRLRDPGPGHPGSIPISEALLELTRAGKGGGAPRPLDGPPATGTRPSRVAHVPPHAPGLSRRLAQVEPPPLPLHELVKVIRQTASVREEDRRAASDQRQGQVARNGRQVVELPLPQAFSQAVKLHPGARQLRLPQMLPPVSTRQLLSWKNFTQSPSVAIPASARFTRAKQATAV